MYLLFLFRFANRRLCECRDAGVASTARKSGPWMRAFTRSRDARLDLDLRRACPLSYPRLPPLPPARCVRACASRCVRSLAGSARGKRAPRRFPFSSGTAVLPFAFFRLMRGLCCNGPFWWHPSPLSRLYIYIDQDDAQSGGGLRAGSARVR